MRFFELSRTFRCLSSLSDTAIMVLKHKTDRAKRVLFKISPSDFIWMAGRKKVKSNGKQDVTTQLILVMASAFSSLTSYQSLQPEYLHCFKQSDDTNWRFYLSNEALNKSHYIVKVFIII